MFAAIMTPLPSSLSAPSYEAFQARFRADFNAKTRLSPNSPFRQQQRLLRVHLRHFLSRAERNTQVDAGSATDESAAVWMGRIKRTVSAQTVAVECKTSVKTRSLRHPRHPVRAQPPMPTRRDEDGHRKFHTVAPRTKEDLSVDSDELELHSTSTFVSMPFDAFHTWSPDSNARDADTVVLPSLDSYESVFAEPVQSKRDEVEAVKFDHEHLFPYELVIELLAARELVISSPRSMASRIAVGAELCILQKGRASQIAQVIVPSVLYNAELDEMAHWQNASLRLGIDPTSEDPIARHDPQVVINEWSISVVARVYQNEDETYQSTGTILGKLEVPLILLETPLAQEYAMCRWFPLEKASPGVRGDIRVRICFSMLQQVLLSENGGSKMVPYKPKIEERVDTKQTNVSMSQLQKRKKKSLSAGTLENNQSTSSAKCDNAAIPSRRTPGSVQNGRYPPSTKSTSFGTRAQTIASSRRPPRMEALSPPSSPSSFSSDNDDLQQKVLTPPRPRRSISARGTKHQDADPPEQPPPPVGSLSSSKPTQPFLKRKPYKVVFRKLDWSSVSSRTDSSWSHGNPADNAASQNHTGVKSAIPTSPRNTKSAQSEIVIATPGATAMAKTPGVNPLGDDEARRRRSDEAVALHPVIKGRLQELSRTVYDCCQVTPQTKSLAQLKYQAERRKYLLVLSHSQSPTPSVGIPTDCPGNASTIHTLSKASNATLSTLWKELVVDVTGALYATQLANLRSEESTS